MSADAWEVRCNALIASGAVRLAPDDTSWHSLPSVTDRAWAVRFAAHKLDLDKLATQAPGSDVDAFALRAAAGFTRRLRGCNP